MDACKKSCLLFLKITRYATKGYEMKKAYADFKKSCEYEDYNSFNNKAFGLILGSIVNKLSTTKNTSYCTYYIIRDSIKNNIKRMSLIISSVILEVLQFNL
jgi:hypothetical protein